MQAIDASLSGTPFIKPMKSTLSDALTQTEMKSFGLLTDSTFKIQALEGIEEGTTTTVTLATPQANLPQATGHRNNSSSGNQSSQERSYNHYLNRNNSSSSSHPHVNVSLSNIHFVPILYYSVITRCSDKILYVNLVWEAPAPPYSYPVAILRVKFFFCGF